MSQLTFIPVEIKRGRKFKGKAYMLGQTTSYSVAWGVDCESTKLWDPKAKRYAYANPDFCEDDETISKEQVEADRKAYIDHTINETAAWCKSVKPDLPEAEMKQFIRNCLRKRHPEMLEYIDAAVPDQRDVVKEVQRTLEWAVSLKTRPCTIYGKFCPGGKPYPPLRSVKTALHSLIRKQITKLDGFRDAWSFIITTMGLPAIDIDEETNAYLNRPQYE